MNNTFSLDRLGMLWHFYSPAIKKQWTYGGIAVVAGYFMMLFGITQLGPFGRPEGPFSVLGFLVFYVGNIIVLWSYYTSPLIFAMCNRRCETVLPALWQEKAVFTIGYSFVLYPLFLILLQWICVGICLPFTDCAMIDAAFLSTLNDVPDELRPLIEMGSNYSWLYIFMIIASCLYAVSFSRRARMIKGIAGILGGLVFYALSGFCIGIYLALRGVSKLDSQVVFDKDAFLTNLLGEIRGALMVWLVAVIVISVLLAVASVWKIKNRQD